MRYDQEIMWIIQPCGFLVARYTVWLIVEKRNKMGSKCKKCIFIGSPKESRVSDFGILRQGALLPEEMWYLTKNQCCKKSQRQIIKYKVELQQFSRYSDKGG